MPRSRTIVRVACVSAVLVVAVFVLASAAFADTYVTAMSVSNDQPTPGSTVTVEGGGFAPNKTAEVLIDSTPVATTTTNANGIATTQITIPATTTSGQHLITIAHLSGGAGRHTLSTSVTVRTHGFAFSNADGHSVSALVVVTLVLLCIAGPFVLRRRVKPAR